MSPFTPVTDAELVRARHDPGFRRKLLANNLEALLGTLQKQRQAPASGIANLQQLREGGALAVRLAELIQTSDSIRRDS